MTQRFQIEDIVIQDESGVTYLAMDRVTRKKVALHRFFPYGAGECGLLPEEQKAYNIAIARLAAVSHPALQKVICGGCDPIDGIPYIATEWVEGKSLQDVITSGPLSPKVAIHMLTQLLDVCDLLSKVFAEEAIWVETQLHTIIDNDETSGRAFTYRISPLKWLGGADDDHRFESVIALTKQIMGWQVQLVSNHSGQGLGSWLNWLRDASAPPTLAEARQMLVSSIGVTPPTPTRRLVHGSHPMQTSSAATGQEKIFSIKKGFLLTGLILVFTGLGGCWWVSRERLSSIANMGFSMENPMPDPPVETDEIQAPISTIIQWDNHQQLMQYAKQRVTIEGVPLNISSSVSGKTIYLLFTKSDDKAALRVAMEVRETYLDTIRENFKFFVGSKVHVTGIVMVRRVSKEDRIEIKIDNLAAVQLAK